MVIGVPMTEKKNQIAVFEEIRKDLDITRDISDFKVAMSDVFGKGSLAVKESFGGVTFKDNSEKVDVLFRIPMSSITFGITAIPNGCGST